MEAGDNLILHAALAQPPEQTTAAAHQQIYANDIESLLPDKPLSPPILQLLFCHILPAKLQAEPGGTSAASSCCVLSPGLYPDLCAAAKLPAEGRAAAYREALDRYPVPLDEPAVNAREAPIGGRLASRSYLLFPLVGGHDPLGTCPVSLLLVCTSGGLLLHLDSQQGAVVGPRNDAKCLRGRLPVPKDSDGALKGEQAVALAQPVLLFLEFLGHTEAAAWPLMSAKVPLQRRMTDSALFAATNALYLLSGLPAMLTPAAVDVLSVYRDTELDLLRGTKGFYPGFLTRQWYPPETAEALRRELARAVRIRVQQASSYNKGTLAAADTALLSRLAEVEKRLEEDCRKREFQMPSQRCKRQEEKQRRRVQKLNSTQRSTRWEKLAEKLQCVPATEEAAKAALKKLQAQLLGSQPGPGTAHDTDAHPGDIADSPHPAAAVGPAQSRRPQRASSRGVSDVVRRAQQQDEALEEEEAEEQRSQSSESEGGVTGSDSDVSEQIAKAPWPRGMASTCASWQQAQQAHADVPVAQPPLQQPASAGAVGALPPGSRPVLQRQGLPAAHAAEAGGGGMSVPARTDSKTLNSKTLNSKVHALLFPMAAAKGTAAASTATASTALPPQRGQQQHIEQQRPEQQPQQQGPQPHQQRPQQQQQQRQHLEQLHQLPLHKRAVAGAYRQLQADADMLQPADDTQPFNAEGHFGAEALAYCPPSTQGSAAGPISLQPSRQRQSVPTAVSISQQQQQQQPQAGQQQQQDSKRQFAPEQQWQVTAASQSPGLLGQQAAATVLAPSSRGVKRPALLEASPSDEERAAKVPRMSGGALRPVPAPAPSPPAPPPPPPAGPLDPGSSPAAVATAVGGSRREAAVSPNRVYSKWTANGRGGYTKELTLSDLNKLRIKGGALANHIDSSDQNVVLSLVADAAGSDNGALPPHQRIGFVVGLWRPKSGSEVKQQLVSLQAGWPAVVSRLKMLAGDTVELQPDGRERLANGTSRPRLLLSVRRAAGRNAVVQATAPTFPVKGMGSGGGVGAGQMPVAATYPAPLPGGQTNALGRTASLAGGEMNVRLGKTVPLDGETNVRLGKTVPLFLARSLPKSAPLSVPAPAMPGSEQHCKTLLGLQAALHSPVQKQLPQRQPPQK